MGEDVKRPEDASNTRDRFYIRPTDGDPIAQKLEDAIIDWINRIRKEKGLPPLEED